MVDGEQHRVVVGGPADHGEDGHRALADIGEPVPDGDQPGRHLVVAVARGVDQDGLHLGLGVDDGAPDAWLGAGHGHEAGAQRGVAAHRLVQGLGQQARVQRFGDAEHHGDRADVAALGLGHPAQEVLLLRGERDVVGLGAQFAQERGERGFVHRGRGLGGPGRGGDPGGLGAQRGAFEDQGGARGDAELGGDGGGELDGAEGVAAEREELVLDGRDRTAEHLAPDGGEGEFGAGGGRGVEPVPRRGCRTVPAVRA